MKLKKQAPVCCKCNEIINNKSPIFLECERVCLQCYYKFRKSRRTLPVTYIRRIRGMEMTKIQC